MKEYLPDEMRDMAARLFREERVLDRLDGWFLAREAALNLNVDGLTHERAAARQLNRIVATLPISLSDDAVFAGTERDAFARSYALINPAFRVESFSGYCDPTAVFDDIRPGGDITAERIDALRQKTAKTEYVRALSSVYDRYESYTAEVAFFVEQVTGHLIPDFREAMKVGTRELRARIAARSVGEADESKRDVLESMTEALTCSETLAARYAALALEKARSADPRRRAQLERMADALKRVPAQGARDLYEAIQSFMLLWQVMCLEQAPNPFAFSVGNADRLFEPYRAACGSDRTEAAEMFCCLLAFFNVADRSWAISQNLIVGGRDADGNDLTNASSYALLDAYYAMNLPQPILSVKLHAGTPEALYRALGRFFFTPGVLTPSLFNDDSIFPVLRGRGVEERDLPDYAIAGCQEMLIMGSDNGNTTNSWLNLPKILELTLTGGKSLITGRQLMSPDSFPAAPLNELREKFYQNVEAVASDMRDAANAATEAVALLPVPFLSAFMGGIETGVDVRDTRAQGSKYNGSGCLIHGLSVIADSLVAVDHLLKERPEDAGRLVDALAANFVGYEDLHRYLKSLPKFGNNLSEPDEEARAVAERVSTIVNSLKNPWGNRFRADWSSPTTHLLYGYWVGAMPDGRGARDMMGYGVDPLYGEAQQGLGFRVLSALKLPYDRFDGGYASHLGIDPKYFRAQTTEEKGLQMRDRVLTPLFFNPGNPNPAPYYLYLNVTTPETLKKVLANPKKYAPSGVYIMRIHGTFVNFLDLSPAIQQDIIARLDSGSTRMDEAAV